VVDVRDDGEVPDAGGVQSRECTGAAGGSQPAPRVGQGSTTRPSCDGVNDNCPADAFQSSATVCRASRGTCDLAEHCTGSGAICPADAMSPERAECELDSYFGRYPRRSRSHSETLKRDCRPHKRDPRPHRPCPSVHRRTPDVRTSAPANTDPTRHAMRMMRSAGERSRPSPLPRCRRLSSRLCAVAK
jgi:hypothetical protein